MDNEDKRKNLLTDENELQKLRRRVGELEALETDHRWAEGEKQKLEAQLLQAQKMEAIGTLAGGIAHDFNNMLQAISGYTQILLMEKNPGHPDYSKLEVIEKAAVRARDLAKQLLGFARRVESEFRPIDLNKEVIQVCKLLRRTIPKMVSIESHLAEDLKIINAEPLQVQQIMMNLAVNAMDAVADGGNLVFETGNEILEQEYCNINLGAKPGNYVLLRVSDTGCGMDKEVIEHIYEPFFTTKETGKGTGLGLAMVYGIVKSHGGYITCNSKPGHGTVFEIYFPVIVQKIKEPDSIELEVPVKGGSETILLVDDEESIRRLCKDILTGFGYNVIVASDGESALELVSKAYNFSSPLDLVILDLIMPGMGGMRFLNELLKTAPKVKVVISSGRSDKRVVKEAIEAGARGFIAKPCDVKQILEVVREVLDED